VTVVVACGESGITPGVKALARHLARHGYAVLVPSPREGFELATADVAAAVRSTRIPGTPWADADRLAIIGIGDGGGPAAVVASDQEADVLALVDASLDADLLEGFGGNLLVLSGAEDAAAPAEEIRAIQQQLGVGEWVLYGGVAGGFFEDDSTTDDAAARDASDRLVALLDERFGVIGAV